MTTLEERINTATMYRNEVTALKEQESAAMNARMKANRDAQVRLTLDVEALTELLTERGPLMLVCIEEALGWDMKRAQRAAFATRRSVSAVDVRIFNIDFALPPFGAKEMESEPLRLDSCIVSIKQERSPASLSYPSRLSEMA